MYSYVTYEYLQVIHAPTERESERERERERESDRVQRDICIHSSSGMLFVDFGVMPGRLPQDLATSPRLRVGCLGGPHKKNEEGRKG